MSMPLLDHLESIGQQVADASHLLVLLDYDGTLTPIVDRPSDAHLPASTREVVQALARLDNTTLVILSGRAVDDLELRVDVDNVIYSGNHGLEISGPDYHFVRSAPGVRTMGELAGQLARSLRHIPGALVEDKRLTLSVHYRMVPENLRDEILKAISQPVGRYGNCIRLTTGNQVYEIRPNLNWNKGSAASWIRNSLGLPPGILTIYVGDDTTDEDAFAALPEGINIRVGNAEQTHAHYHLPKPADVRGFLQWLAALNRPKPHEVAET